MPLNVRSGPRRPVAEVSGLSNVKLLFRATENMAQATSELCFNRRDSSVNLPLEFVRVISTTSISRGFRGRNVSQNVALCKKELIGCKKRVYTTAYE